MDRNKKLFFVGIGGIGMSGLAQLARWHGYSVAGSDRGLQEPGKQELYQALRQQGIVLYNQDGSGIAVEKPDVLVVSTAVEEGNPDLVAGKAIGAERLHRAHALKLLLEAVPRAKLITVAGSCGKTTVTGWIASALHALGEPVLVVNGGYCNDIPLEPGNFCADANPRWLVAEVDESDKSISEFSPDYGVLLNIGDDHYERAELLRVFQAYLERCKQGVVIPSELRAIVPEGVAALEFSEKNAGFHPVDYASHSEGIQFRLPQSDNIVQCRQWGFYSAVNACAVLALLKQLSLKYPEAELCRAVGRFSGVRQRFELMGRRCDNVPFINDYAHNPEKIAAAIQAARERFGAPLFCVFQPHGFTPFGFMREALKEHLQKILQPEDSFCFLPVFYAGGTAAFSPTSQEVAEDFRGVGLPVEFLERSAIERRLASIRPAAVLVMGARDSSLRPWTRRLADASVAHP